MYEIGYFCCMPRRLFTPPPGFGAWVVTSKYEIENDNSYIAVDDIGNGKAWVENHRLDSQCCRIGFYDRDICGRTHCRTFMLGAISGDVAGSVYEHHNIKYLPDKDKLIQHHAHFTDDSVLTLAVGVGIMNGMKKIGKYENFTQDDEKIFIEQISESLSLYGHRYAHAGYGRTFKQWLNTGIPVQGSWSNGSAMRVSHAGFMAHSLADAEFLASVSAKITHNHPEGIKGAVAVAGSIQILVNSLDNLSVDEAKQEVRRYLADKYELNFTLDEIRENYSFDVSCAGSVPQAIEAFLEGDSFEEVLALAISIGGDSDTIAAIAGSLAEVVYPIPEGIRNRVLRRLDYQFKSELAGAIDFMIDHRNK